MFKRLLVDYRLDSRRLGAFDGAFFENHSVACLNRSWQRFFSRIVPRTKQPLNRQRKIVSQMSDKRQAICQTTQEPISFLASTSSSHQRRFLCRCQHAQIVLSSRQHQFNSSRDECFRQRIQNDCSIRQNGIVHLPPSSA